jgi:hypothetical protein
MKPDTTPWNAMIGMARLALLLLCLLLPACAAGPERAHDAPPSSVRCLPEFPDRDGWYGGDGACSIPLDDRRVLWLFGDTFVSDQEGRRDRAGMKVVLGTTLAVSTCSADGQFQIRYWLKKRDGEFVSSFGEGEWLWPQDPFMVDRILYVPLVSVAADPRREGALKFRIAGHRIARIRNYAEADPNRWAADYMDLTSGIPVGVEAFATTSVVFGDHVYFYPLYRGAGVLGNILARIPANRLDDPAPAIEYWTRDGRWERGLDPAKIRIVLDAAVSELSVRHHPDDGTWVAVYLSVEHNGRRMLYQMANAPEGPWTEPKVLIGAVPEVDRGSPRYDPDNFCYAGREHPEFGRGRTLVVTYVCNSFADAGDDASFIRKNLFLYRPVVATPSR